MMSSTKPRKSKSQDKTESLESKFRYPFTKKVPVTRNYHGIEVVDNYEWLESKNPTVSSWVVRQNDFVRNYLEGIKGKEGVRKELEGLSRLDSMSLYRIRNGRYFYLRQKPGQNQEALYYKESLNGEEKVLIDPNKMSKDGTKALYSFSPSPNGKLVAFQITAGGNDRTTIQVIDIEKKRNTKRSHLPY